MRGDERISTSAVKTLQCGEFKYPDVSSPLCKILAAKDAERRSSPGHGLLFDYNSSPKKNSRITEDFGIRGGLSVSPYNPHFDEVFQMSSRTPDISPFRHHLPGYAFQRFSENYRSIQSPESDVGYGTSFGSQELSGHTLDMDILSNLVVSRSLSLSNGTCDSKSAPPPPPPPTPSSTMIGGPSLSLADFGDVFKPDSREERCLKAPRATIGPCLAELDPAVAQASPFEQDFGNFTNLLSPLRKSQPTPMKQALYGMDALGLENVAKMHRSSASHHDATCTWRGQLPPRSHSSKTLSVKVFLGGVPWDITEQNLIQAFRPFGPIRIEWPGKDMSCVPKGYLYIIFDNEKQVRNLLLSCTQDFGSGSGAWYYKISSKRMRNKEVQVIPWVIADSTYVRCPATRLDSGKTVFVGALHGMLSAEALANIFQDLFKGVVYAGIDTDKYKYPIGSGRVVFNNHHSYMKAVSAAFIEIKTTKFTKKIQVDPYLEDALCSHCNLRQGPYYCRDLDCFKYYCRSCWDTQHIIDSMCHHRPIMRNSRNSVSCGGGGNNNNNGHSKGHGGNNHITRGGDNLVVTMPHMSPFEL